MTSSKRLLCIQMDWTSNKLYSDYILLYYPIGRLFRADLNGLELRHGEEHLVERLRVIQDAHLDRVNKTNGPLSLLFVWF